MPRFYFISRCLIDLDLISGGVIIRSIIEHIKSERGA